MLSQVRWMMSVAIGIAVVVAVWLEPDVRDPAGEPARPRPGAEARARRSAGDLTPVPGAGGAGQTRSASAQWQARIAAYWAELDALLADPSLAGREREAAREALLAQHFEVAERGQVRALDAGRARRAQADGLQNKP